MAKVEVYTKVVDHRGALAPASSPGYTTVGGESDEKERRQCVLI
jgi:hypothetical protein